eukprot:3309012-Pleurochrysis_carterae.AAC.3
MRSVARIRAFKAPLSTLAPALGNNTAVPVALREDGLAALTKTLPIHRRDELPMEPRPGASMIEV